LPVACGRRRRRLAGGNLELHHCLNFFGHCRLSLCHEVTKARNQTVLFFVFSCFRGYIFSTCRKSSSTGVDLPKIVTITFSVFLSRFTSSTTPLKLVNGPSLIRTCSPFSNMYFGFGFSAAVRTCCTICSTSSLLRGVGC